MWIGIALAASPFLILPVLLFGLLHVSSGRSPWSAGSGPGSPGFSSRSNTAVIASLSASVNTPWDWQELEKRLAVGSLSDAEIAQAIDEMIAYLNTQPTNEPLPWSESFLQKTDSANKITDEQYTRLARAFYKSGRVTMAAKSRAGKPVAFKVHCGGPWQLPGCEFVYALRQVTIGGGGAMILSHDENPNPRKPNADLFSAKAPWDISGNTLMNVAPGSYTLTFTVDVGVLRAGTAPLAVNNLPGQASGWPEGRAAWTEVITVPIGVVAGDQSPIGLITDSAHDPQTLGAMEIKSIKAIRKGTGQRVTADFSIDGNKVPCSFDVVLRIAGREYPAGFVVSVPNTGMSTEHAVDLGSLDPSVQDVDVLLRPNPARAEGIAGIDRIWGREVDVLKVPMERYDLQGN